MASPASYLLYVVCFTQGQSPGLQVFRMDAGDGSLAHVETPATKLVAPLFAETDRENRFLYITDCVNDVDGVPGGAVAAFAIDRVSGKTTFINRVSSGGITPCYLSVAPDRRFLLVANYSDGVVALLPINPDGSLRPPADRSAHKRPEDKKANAHCVVFDNTSRFALSADLGVNRIFSYRPDGAALKLQPIDAPPAQTKAGAGPRHLAFHPNGRFVYCQTEYDNTVIAMSYDGQSGTVKIIQTETSLPAGYSEKSYGADIQVHPGGRFLYSTNRGHESIAIFAIDPDTGHITAVGHEPTRGVFPRDFTIDPAGKFLLVANEKSDSIVTFRIDQKTGKLDAVGEPTKVVKPACMKLVVSTEFK